MFAVLAALLGAFVASFLAHVLAIRRENARSKEDRRRESERERRVKKRQADRERRELLGLLKLVHVEVVNNLELLKKMGAHSGTFFKGNEKMKRGPDNLEASKLSTEAWDQARNRIAALIEDEERLKYLISGYAALSVFKDRLLNPDTDGLTEEEHKESVRKVKSHQWLSFDACEKETGMFWAYSKGMLVSEPAEDLAEAEENFYK